jgi:pimeloyl-ACP methyl ester carboxylesterase
LRYYLASLAELAGGGVAVLAVVGLTDEGMPPAIGQSYLHQANPNGVDVRLGEIPAAGHFDVVDPARPSWADVRLWITGRVSGPQNGPGRTELPAELHEGQR